MVRPMTVEELLPLVAGLTPRDRARLLRMIAASPEVSAAAAYKVMPPSADEFSSDEDPLAWEANGWEEVG
jgi:hypothetical protein